MTDSNQRALAETIFERGQRREREISDALKLEAKRHEAVVRNMHRLRAFRLSREEKEVGRPLNNTGHNE
jgi:hypothetical protein